MLSHSMKGTRRIVTEPKLENGGNDAVISMAISACKVQSSVFAYRTSSSPIKGGGISRRVGHLQHAGRGAHR
jgi:hypothetical protein